MSATPSWVPGPPPQPLKTSRLPHCLLTRLYDGSRAALPRAQGALARTASSPAQSRDSPRGTLCAVLLPGGTETCPCGDPLPLPRTHFGLILPGSAIFKVKGVSNKKSLPFHVAVPKGMPFILPFCLQHAISSVQQTVELLAVLKTYLVAMVTSSSKYHYQIIKKNTCEV